MKKFACIVSLLMVLLLSGCTFFPQDTGIYIGLNLALSGKGMSYSLSTEQGVELAKDQLNEEGGLLGKTVELVTIDNHGKPADAVAAIQQLTVRHVAAIIGPDISDCARAVIPNVEAVGIPLISPAGTQPDLTVDPQTHEVYQHMFRATFIDASQSRAMADYALKQLGAQQAAVFYYPDEPYAQGLADYFRSAFIAGGGSVPIFQEVKDPGQLAGKRDFLQQAGIDVVYLPGYDDWTLPAIRNLRQSGVTLPLLGPDGWNSLKMQRELEPEVLQNLYVTDHYAGAETSPEAAAFAQAYYEKYGTWPDSYAALGYDTMMLVAQAIERSHSAKASDVASELVKTIDYPGVTGKISLDANHDAIRDVYIMRFTGGSFSRVASIHP